MIGVDEVGRGAWAGPMLVVAARQISDLPAGLKDSKKLSRARREKLALSIKQKCDIGEGWVTSDEIDRLGLSDSLRLATKRALTSIKAKKSEKIIIDGNINFAGEGYLLSKCLVNADESEPLVSAASIVAKVTRDAVMRQIDGDHPQYGFNTNVGYGTSGHIQALKKHGVVKGLHRLSFKPIRQIKYG